MIRAASLLCLLLEEDWLEDWDTAVADFGEMQDLGANLVRIHLQLGSFLRAPVETDRASREGISSGSALM
jgi:hypothetical protein